MDTIDPSAAAAGEAAELERRDALPAALRNDLLFAAMRLRRMAIVFSDPNQPDNPIVYCNAAFVEQSGYPASEVIGRNCRFLQGPATDRATVRRIRAALDAGQGFNEELYNYRRDGRGFWNALYVSPITDADGRVLYFLGSQTDVTARRQQALRQESRLDMTGAMAAGVGGRFDELMRVVIGNIEQAHAVADERSREWLGQAHLAARHAGRLTRQVLGFAQHQALDAREVDLNHAVRELDSLLAQVVGAAITVELDLSGEAEVARLDQGQLDLALVHLVRNAAEAMPKGGRITLRTWNSRSWEPARGRNGQGWVELSVRDEGEGMASRIVRQAADPFFTTRARAKGIGLALVQDFVETAGGRMQIETSPGRGTTVRLSFPQVEEPA